MKNKDITQKILITGGGSGGHISVASALIDGIRNKYPETFNNLIYVGGDLGMVGEEFGNSLEQKRFKDVDFKTYFIRAGKLQRKISLTTIKLAFRTLRGLHDAYRVIKHEKTNLNILNRRFCKCTRMYCRMVKGSTNISPRTDCCRRFSQPRLLVNLQKRYFSPLNLLHKYFKQKKKCFQTGNVS